MSEILTSKERLRTLRKTVDHFACVFQREGGASGETVKELFEVVELLQVLENAPETPGELEQLRRIDKAARAFIDARPGKNAAKAYEALSDALFDGRPAQETEVFPPDMPDTRLCLTDEHAAEQWAAAREVILQTNRQAIRLLHVLRAYSWTCANLPDQAREDPLYPQEWAREGHGRLWQAVDVLLKSHPYVTAQKANVPVPCACDKPSAIDCSKGDYLLICACKCHPENGEASR